MFNPRNFTEENKSNSNHSFSADKLTNSESSNLTTAEYATYINPQLLHTKQSNPKSAKGFVNPNYEDSIQATTMSRESKSKSSLNNIPVSEVNSPLQRRNEKSKNHTEGDYSFADELEEYHETNRNPKLTDDNLDYESPPDLFVTVT